MKKQIIALAALAAVSAAHADVIAGWDFSQYAGAGAPTIDGATLATGFDANYSQFDATFGAGAESAAFGNFHMNGLFGSTVASGANFSPASGSLSSNIAGTGGVNPFDSFSILANEGQTFTQAVSQQAAAGTSYVFEVDASSLGGAAFWSVDFGAVESGGDATLNVSYSTDGTSYTGDQLIDITNLDTAYSLNLAAGASNSLYVKFDTAGAFSVVDNVAISGTVVPEPSSYAALAGVIALGIASIRRRRK